MEINPMLDDGQSRRAPDADDRQDVAPLVDLVANYTAEIEYRRRQLCDELLHFETKLRDLTVLDPFDFTGLAKISHEHANHIRRLLAGFDTPDFECNPRETVGKAPAPAN